LGGYTRRSRKRGGGFKNQENIATNQGQGLLGKEKDLRQNGGGSRSPGGSGNRKKNMEVGDGPENGRTRPKPKKRDLRKGGT